MKTSSKWAKACTIGIFICLGLYPLTAQSQTGTASVARVAVIGNDEGLGIQISTSGPVTTEAQILTNPDRLVIDFPGALPGRTLRSLRLNQGQIRAVRAGLWLANPPVTRIVIDLDQPTAYRLEPGERAILVRLWSPTALTSAESLPGVTVERHPTARAITAVARSAEPPLRVRFDRGLLTISARKATLAEVLYQVQIRTGANIPIPSGAEQEQVAIQAGPGPAKDVIAALLNGSRFNYVLQGTPQDPQGVGAVILTPKGNISEEPYTPPLPPTQAAAPADTQLAAPTAPPNAPMQADPVSEPNPEIPPNPELPPNPEEPQE